jgi:hypothetical protein
MKETITEFRTETECKSSGLSPVIYQTKITKKQLIPLFRVATSKRETGDILCLVCDSFDPKLKVYTQRISYPYLSLVAAEEVNEKRMNQTSNEQMTLDMAHNCLALGIQVQDGEKEEGWKAFEPAKVLASVIPLGDLTRYYNEVKTLNPAEVVAAKEVITPKIVVPEGQVEDPDKFVEPPYHMEHPAAGKRGPPHKVYEDKAFDTAIKAIPAKVQCKGCGKEVVIVPLNIMERSKKSGVAPDEILKDYKCRSCKPKKVA